MGGQGIHGDAAFGIILAHHLDETDEPRLGRRIGGHAGIAFLAGDRGDVEYAAIAVLQHMRQHGLRRDQRAFEIDLIDAIEVLERNFMRLYIGLPHDAGAIDETMQLPVRLDD